MARVNTIKVLRATRAALTSQAGSSGLIAGEPYLITDEGRIAVATSTSAFETFVKESEITPNTVTLTSGDTTPSVAALGGRNGVVYLPATSNYTITNFDDGSDGQEILVFHSGTHNVTVNRANAYLSGSTNQTIVANGSLRLLKLGSFWYQVGPTMSAG